MKKLLLLALLLLAAPLAKAQDIYYGPSVGLNLSTITKQTFSNDYLRGNLGVHVGYNLTNEITLHGELLYSWQGMKYNDADARISLNYIKIPVLARLNIVNGMSLEAGMSFNFLTYAKQTNITTVEGGGYSDELDLMGTMNHFDLTIPVGINYLFAQNFEIGLRYDMSMLRVFKNSDNKSRNSNLSLNFRYRL